MNDYYPLGNSANTLCQGVDLLVASCNKINIVHFIVFTDDTRNFPMHQAK